MVAVVAVVILTLTVVFYGSANEIVSGRTLEQEWMDLSHLWSQNAAHIGKTLAKFSAVVWVLLLLAPLRWGLLRRIRSDGIRATLAAWLRPPDEEGHED